MNLVSKRQLFPLADGPGRGGILVTENGCAVADDDVNVAKNDKFRVEFYQGQEFEKLSRGLRSLETAELR